MLFCSDHFEFVCFKVVVGSNFFVIIVGRKGVAGPLSFRKKRKLSKTVNQYWRDNKIAKGTDA